MVHKHTLFLLGVLACIAGNAKGDMPYDYCRYQFHVQPLNWMAASNVCNMKNRTLLKVNNEHELRLIVNVAKETVYPKMQDYPDLLSEIWIGLRAQSVEDSIRHNWENCDLMTKNDAVWGISNYNTITGCVAIMLSETKYNVFDCISESRPYICEAASPVPCYDKVMWTTEPAFSSLTNLIEIESIDLNDCKMKCMMYSQCIGFQKLTKCKMLKYTNAMPTDIDLNSRSSAYTIGFMDLNSYTVGITPPLLSNTCIRSSSSPQVRSTFSYLPITTTASFAVTSTERRSETSLSSSGLPFATQYLTSLHALSTPGLTSVSDIIQMFPSSEAVSGDHSSVNNTGCMCPCSLYRNKTFTPEEFGSRIKEIKEKLTVDRKKTSVHKRSLISAPDERLSVQRIGYVGVAVLMAICGILVLMDMPRSVTCLKDFLQKCK